KWLVSVLFLLLFIASKAHSFGGSATSTPQEKQAQQLKEAALISAGTAGFAAAIKPAPRSRDPKWVYTPPDKSAQAQSEGQQQTSAKPNTPEVSAPQTPVQSNGPSQTLPQPNTPPPSVPQAPQRRTQTGRMLGASDPTGTPSTSNQRPDRPIAGGSCASETQPAQDVVTAIDAYNGSNSRHSCSVEIYKKILSQCVPQKALDDAWAFMRANPKAIPSNGLLAITDFSENVNRTDPRFFLINLNTGQVEKYRVAGGLNKDGVEELSDTKDSNLTPPGFLRFNSGVLKGAKKMPPAKEWDTYLTLQSLEPKNSRSNFGDRSIVVHPAIDLKGKSYVSDKSVRHTLGCLALNPNDFEKIAPRLQGGLLYNYQKEPLGKRRPPNRH
ncbi:MAG: murein L,D-transpeptidase catalytic domain-containing protein, partial [Pseudobdellovibrionaceae bacterium]